MKMAPPAEKMAAKCGDKQHVPVSTEKGKLRGNFAIICKHAINAFTSSQVPQGLHQLKVPLYNIVSASFSVTALTYVSILLLLYTFVLCICEVGDQSN